MNVTVPVGQPVQNSAFPLIQQQQQQQLLQQLQQQAQQVSQASTSADSVIMLQPSTTHTVSAATTNTGKSRHSKIIVSAAKISQVSQGILKSYSLSCYN